MKRFIRKYRQDESGQFAVMTAIFAVPLLLAVGIAIDTATIHKKSVGLQGALDSAALAAVVPGNLDNAQRAALAEKVFHENYDKLEVDLEVVATPDRVDLKGTVNKKTLMMGLYGKTEIQQTNLSSAIKTAEDVICLMTLNKTARGALKFEKNARLNAPACSVQVNSSDQNALIAAGNYQPQAKRICVHGGVNGNVGPNTQSNCSVLNDPYAHLKAPVFAGDNSACNYGPLLETAASSVLQLGFSIYSGMATRSSTSSTLDNFSTSFAVGEVGGFRYPGVYCNGMHFFDSEVTLMPGTYYIHNGPLSFGGGSKVTGDGVTFVFTGEDSYLYTYDEVELNLTASRSGDYAGLIFFQDPKSNPNGVSIIKGNANIRLIGTSYFPTQDLYVGGLGNMGANSPAMAFIADKITLTSDIDSIISDQEAEFQQFKNLILSGSSILYQFGLSAYQPVETSATGGALSGNQGQDFTTTVLTSLSSSRQTGMPFAMSDGGARLVSTADSPLKDSGQ